MDYSKFTKKELISRIDILERDISEISESADSTFHHAAVGIAHVSQAGNFIRVNKMFAQMFGYEADTMHDMTVADISYPGEINPSTPEVQKVWQGELDHFSTEKRYVRKDKSTFWGNLTISHKTSSQEGQEYNIAVLQDISDKKQATNNFLQEKAFTDNLIKNIPGHFFICSIVGREFRLKQWNNNLETVTGYSAEELVNKNILDFFSEQDYPVINEAIDDLYKTGSISIELVATMKSGENIPVHYEGFLFSEEGKNFYIGIGFDITKRVKALEILRKNEEKYSAVVENSNDAIAILREGKIIYANKAAEAGLGYSRAEILEKGLLDIVAPEFREEVVQRNQARFAGENASQLTEIELLRKDATRIPVEVNSSVIDYEGAPGVLVLIRDISERKITENKLKESEERFRLLSGLTNEGVVIHRDGFALEVNQAFCDIFGYSVNEIIGTNPMTKIFSPDNIEKLLETFKSDNTPPHELEGIKKDGSIITILAEGRSIMHKNERVRVGTIRDISHQKKTEEELKIKEQSIESSINAIGIADLDGKMVYINQAGVGFWGYSNKEEIIGKSLREFWQEGYVNSQLRDLKEKGFSINEGRGVKKDGSCIDIQYSVHMVKNERGEPQYIYGSFIDITEQKKAEEALKSSEERMKIIFESAPDAIYLIDLKGNYIDANKAAEKMLGYTKEELIGKNLLKIKFLPVKEIFKASKQLADNLQGKRTGPNEFILNRKDGSQIHVEISTYPVKIKNKTLVLGIARDITERKKAENELQKYREHLEELVKSRTAELEETAKENIKLSKAVEQSYATVVITDKEGNIEYVNENFTRTTGYTFADVNGQNPRILKSDEMPNSHYKEMWETIAAGEIWKGEFINKKKNGEIYWESAIISSLNNEKGEITHYVAVKEDITERKEVEEELRQFKLFADTSIEGFGMADLNSLILYQNKRLCDLCGIEEAKMNESFLQFYPEKSKKRLRDIILPELIKEGHWRGELDHLHAEGGTFPTVHNFFVIRDEKGQPERLAATITDITERKQIESELKKSKEIAEEANRTKSAFLANMSHEIRTPMNSILGFTEMLSSKIDDPKQISHLTSIRSSGRSLLNLINDILDLSKVEAGGIDINNDLIGTRAFFNDLRNIFHAYSKEKNLDFNFTLAEDFPPGFYLDELRLRQILTNLLGNAVKFTNKGSVSLSIHQKISDELSSTKTKETFIDLIIRVEDTGIGISDDFLPKLFNTFQQEDGEISRRYGGTGLGLAISKRLAELMNGDILVDNSPDKGSIFTLYFKQVKVSSNIEEQIPTSFSTMDQPVFPKGTVLIADDHAEIRNFFSEIFADTGLVIKVVSDGKKAFNQARKIKPDLILTDIKMPVMDGYELNKKIKKHPDLQGIPVIAITASAMKEEIEKIRQSKFEGLLLKPISFHDLMAEVQKYIKPEKILKKLIKRQASVEIQITDKERGKLPELIKIIDKDWVRDWEKLQKQQAMADVELFGKKIRNAGEEYQIGFLTHLGQQIIQAVQAFDIERIRKFIKEFPNIVETLKKMQ